MFKANTRYNVKVCIYPCCPTAFCACKPAELTLTVLRKTRHHVIVAPVPEMKTTRPKRCKLRGNGSCFDIDLVDNGDHLKRVAHSTVYASNEVAESDSEDDDTPLSVLAERMLATVTQTHSHASGDLG